ncbi:uncharacterized protein LOC122191830 [Lagopus leucura]|uniref:uncharacterized protein LOC122191830 n=1 Tax=Lagopus leucura TaxID=30410 RepID=UPI001C686702|nr:uncharacterized protein LOC122191830 [Lagopus leucura]
MAHATSSPSPPLSLQSFVRRDAEGVSQSSPALPSAVNCRGDGQQAGRMEGNRNRISHRGQKRLQQLQQGQFPRRGEAGAAGPAMQTDRQASDASHVTALLPPYPAARRSCPGSTETEPRHGGSGAEDSGARAGRDGERHRDREGSLRSHPPPSCGNIEACEWLRNGVGTQGSNRAMGACVTTFLSGPCKLLLPSPASGAMLKFEESFPRQVVKDDAAASFVSFVLGKQPP